MQVRYCFNERKLIALHRVFERANVAVASRLDMYVKWVGFDSEDAQLSETIEWEKCMGTFWRSLAQLKIPVTNTLDY